MRKQYFSLPTTCQAENLHALRANRFYKGAVVQQWKILKAQ
jgi:hypothetical protein